ncbi:unnamed protein product [Sphenostylis stenocarpa]|uniref:Uncharacterized protein n=1 Tax=Sphenostylis stenocarpa TaxID=92480 RepID=A0AA86V6N3_9FABA|nr:unnamed protein product [Sphenostylis stenocarpa]
MHLNLVSEREGMEMKSTTLTPISEVYLLLPRGLWPLSWTQMVNIRPLDASREKPLRESQQTTPSLFIHQLYLF